MAILHIDKSGVRARRIGAGAMVFLALAGGLAVVVSATGPSIKPTSESGRRGTHGPDACCVPARGPVTVSPVASGGTVAAPASARPEAARLYRTALLYSDCLAQVDAAAEAAAEPADERYQIDPSGGFAARLNQQEEARRAPCRGLGPHEFRQIDGLMRDAARQGDRDAMFFLLDREVQTAAAAAAAQTPVATDVGTKMVAQVDALAANGHAPAMRLAAQLRVGGLLVAPDPVRAAAWALAADEVERGHSPTESELGNSGLLASLNDDEAAQARHGAAALLAACCKFR